MKRLEEKQENPDRKTIWHTRTHNILHQYVWNPEKVRRTLLPVVACLMAVGLSNPYSLAENYVSSGELRFPEDTVQFMESSEISLQRFAPTELSGLVSYRDLWSLETNINHINPDTPIQFLATEDQVWAYVQYFTDVDGDGVYEWVMDENNVPQWQTVAKGNSLIPISQVADWHKMAEGQVRVVDATVLFRAGVAVEEARVEQLGLEYTHSGNIIYCVTFASTPLHRDMSGSSLRSYYITIDGKGWSDPQVMGAYTFEDVAFTDWFFDAVDVCTTRGLFFGTTNYEFSPYSSLTRAMVLQAIYNMHGSPEVYTRAFADIDQDQWYAPAFTWALNQGVAGAENGVFRPNDLVTREELAGFIYNYAKSVGKVSAVSGKLSEFNDYKQVSAKQTSAMLWATKNDLMDGDKNGNLNPTATATRAETAFVLATFLDLFE